MPAAVVPAATGALAQVTLRAPVFISDLHLSSARPRSAERCFALLHGLAGPGRELLVLGDLFETWAGDDILEVPREQASADERLGQDVARALRALADAGTRVYLMHGNRDLLLGESFLAASGAQRLADPCVATLGAGERILLSHGDAYCTRDLPYMAFRRLVRLAAVQALFLSRTLAARQRLLGRARARSEAGKRMKARDIMDVTPRAIDAALRAAGVRTIIHGHTHRPARHEFVLDGEAAVRWVLPDWDMEGAPERGGGLRYTDGNLIEFRA